MVGVTQKEREEIRRRAGHLGELIAQAMTSLGRDEDLHHMFAARVVNRLYAAAERLDILPLEREAVIGMVRTNGKRIALARSRAAQVRGRPEVTAESLADEMIATCGGLERPSAWEQRLPKCRGKLVAAIEEASHRGRGSRRVALDSLLVALGMGASASAQRMARKRLGEAPKR
jgi:hypothetical protein